jgi:hypothetical protein
MTRIDMDAFHGRQIDHQAAVDRRPSGDIVPAAANCDLQIQRSRQLHRVGDIRRSGASRNEGRVLVDEAIVNAPRLVISRVGWFQQPAAERSGELSGIDRRRHGILPGERKCYHARCALRVIHPDSSS